MRRPDETPKPSTVGSALNEGLGVCPFCGSKWVKLHQFGHCFVLCHGCLTYGATAKTKADVIFFRP